MVDIGDIQTQEPRAPRLNLSELTDEMELVATFEKFQPASVLNVQDEQTKQVKVVRKTAGLLIVLQTRDGKTFPQKYSKMSGTALKEALGKLKLKRTEDLQAAWYVYKKMAMEMGNPRMIPIKKAIDQSNIPKKA